MTKPSFLRETGTVTVAEGRVDGAREVVPGGGAASEATPGGLAVREICKTYGGDVWANDRVSLTVEPGEVYGLLGPNGAGKTTLVSQIIGLLAPTSGSIQLGPVDLVADPAMARRLCSYLPQAQMPIEPLRARTAIEMMGRIRGGEASEVRQRTRELLSTLEIEEWENQFGNSLSGGVKRLVGFAMATVQPGALVILDEPTNDVDPLRRRLLWERIREIAAAGSSVLLVTHNVLEAERSVDRLAVIDQGRVIAEGTAASLKAAERGRLRLQLTLEPGQAAPARPAFADAPTLVGRRMLLTLSEASAVDGLQWARSQVESGVAEEYELGPTTLEDTYVRLIGRPDALEMNGGAA